METDTETTNGGVLLEGDNKAEGLDETGGEESKSKSNDNRTEEGEVDRVKTNRNKIENEMEQELNTETEEATIMGTVTEVFGGSGLQKHAEKFHAKGVAAARTEEIENRMTEATEAKNSEGLIKGTISGKALFIGGWDGCDSNELVKEDIMDGDEEKTEELADDDEKTCDMEDKNTNRNKGGKNKEKDTMDVTGNRTTMRRRT